MKSHSGWSFACLFLILAVPQLAGATDVGGVISSGTTWTAASNPYIVTSDLTIANGVTLSVQAGVIVKFNSTRQMFVDGTLLAVGTSGSPITFTSNTTATTKGYWRSIYFRPTSVNSQLSYVTVNYGGRDDETSGDGSILIDGCSPALTNVTVSNSATEGIRVKNSPAAPTISSSAMVSNNWSGLNVWGGTSPTITSTAFTNNGDYGINTGANANLLGLGGLTFTGNGSNTKNGIGYWGGPISISETWRSGATWFVIEDVTVATSGTLTIQPGVTVKMDDAQQMFVDGRLTAVGTAASPIVFMAKGSGPANPWRSIYLRSTASASQLSYVTATYGGRNDAASGYAAIVIDGCSPSLDHVTVSYSDTDGLKVMSYPAAPMITTSTMLNNVWAGLSAWGGTSPTITSTAFTNNGGYGIATGVNTNLLGLTGLTFTNNASNTGNGIGHMGGGTITGNDVWRVGATWFLLDDVTVGSPTNTTASLTIQPGVTVKVDRLNQLFVSGRLTAVGSAAAPIVFMAKSINPSADPWRSIYLRSTASASQLSFVTATYGGANDAPTGQGAIVIDGCSPSLNNVTVSYSDTDGIKIVNYPAAPTITSSTMQNNSWAGLSAWGGTSPTITSTAFTSNGGYGIATGVNTNLLGLTGLTFTNNASNTGNGVGHMGGGTITGNDVWRPGATWFVLDDFTVGSPSNTTASLTIQPGITVKMDYAQQIFVDGRLTAVGTAAAPIVFTAALGNPAANPWRSIYLRSTASASQLSYVTISYGGKNDTTSGYASIVIDGSSPSLNYVTVSNSLTDGIRIINYPAAPTITSSTMQSNAWAGLGAWGGTSPTITSTAFTSNGDYGITTGVNTNFLGFTGLTFTNNGVGAKNGVGYWGGGTITGNDTWRAGATWFILEDITVGSPTNTAASLTIQPGVNVRMDNSQQIFVDGRLNAIGTAAAPITFTSNQSSPTAGYWRSIYFRPTANNSQLSYVTASYGGKNDAASGLGIIYVNGSAPVLDHLTLTNSATHALSAGNNASLQLTNSTLASNAWSAVENFNPAIPFSARLNYWNHLSGPSGQGSGTGQGVGAGVTFEPWLVAAPSQPHFVASALPKNRYFNPVLEVPTKLGFSTSLDGAWSVTYRNGGGATVKTFSGTGPAASLSWDGRNESGVLQPNGTYTYDVAGTATSGPVATVARGYATLDTNRQLTSSSSSIAPPFFSPNGDGVQDTTVYSGAFSFDDVEWQVVVKDSLANVLRTATGVGSEFSYAWNGRDEAAQLQPDSPYTLELSAAVGLGTATSSGTATLDNTPPIALVTSPTLTETVSNVYQNGLTDVTVTGTADDLNHLNWTLEYGLGASPASWTALQSNVPTPVVNGQLTIWPTATRPNGLHSLRLRVADKAGNTTTALATPTIGNFSVTQSVLQLNSTQGQTQSYVSIVPFPLSETLTVLDQAGETVRTLVGGSNRGAGDYTDPWNGRNDNNQLVPDGFYKYVATVTDGTHSMSWDLSSQFLNDFNEWGYVTPLPFDPFNNNPMAISYNFSQPGRVTILATKQDISHIAFSCEDPNICVRLAIHEEAGPHTFRWAGVDSSGAYVHGIKRMGVASGRASFSKSGVVVFGSKPVISNVAVQPPVYGPMTGSQEIDFDLSSYQSQAVTVEVTYINQESVSTLRTITENNVSPGQVTLEWDGRADNGMWVAPGRYTVTVKVTDPIGNIVSSQVLTNVLY